MGLFDKIISKLSEKQAPKTSGTDTGSPQTDTKDGKISVSDPEFQDILLIIQQHPRTAIQSLDSLSPYLAPEAFEAAISSVSSGLSKPTQAPKTAPQTGTPTPEPTPPPTVSETTAPKADPQRGDEGVAIGTRDVTWKTDKKGPDGKAIEDTKSVEGEEAYEKSKTKISGTPTTLKEVASMTVEDVNKYPSMPGGPAARPILKGPLGGDWFLTKSLLLNNAWPSDIAKEAKPDPETMGLLMDKLIALRYWEYDSILAHIRDNELKAKFPDKSGKELLEWGSAGSGARTSDVDINLKGAGNMQAVGLFNTHFANRWGGLEAGTVYDVNVYQMDFMHGFNDPVETQEKGKFEYTTKKEVDIKDKEKQAEDDKSQNIWSLVKMRRYMDDGQWKDYQKQCGFDPDAPPSDTTKDLAETFLKVETRYTTYKNELETETAKSQKWEEGQTQRLITLGIEGKKAKHFAEASSGMRAANAIYEKKIAEIIQKRAHLDDLRSKKAPQDQIDDVALELRDLISESLLFANEAYVTDGAVNHAVVGVQILGGKEGATKRAKEKAEEKQVGSGALIKEADLSLAPPEMLASFNENVGDWVKEQGHFLHDPNRTTDKSQIGGAVYKGGKYLQRLGLAADTLPGLNRLLPQQSQTLANIKGLGEAAMVIKGDNKRAKPEDDSYDAYTNKGFTGNLPTFTDSVVGIGAAVASAYRAQNTPQQPPPTTAPQQQPPTNAPSGSGVDTTAPPTVSEAKIKFQKLIEEATRQVEEAKAIEKARQQRNK